METHDDIPSQLQPFLPMVMKWGAIEGDGERYNLAEAAEADPIALAELKAFNDAWTPDIGWAYEDWSDRVSMTENKVVARFYFALLLLDELGFKLPRDEQLDPVDELIEQLSSHRDTERAWAARKLPDFEGEAGRAIPQLQAALDDSSVSVRIWAHYALARLNGDASEHREAIQTLGAFTQDELETVETRDALDCLDRSLGQHRIEALGGFCISNVPEQIRRLAPITEIDGLDHNGQRPMQYAVGNGHPEAVRILLEHGADPNLQEPSGATYLHTAVGWRDNIEIIQMLVDHGAEVNALDSEGQAPLDLAIALKWRKSNAVLLRSLGARRGRGFVGRLLRWIHERWAD